MSKKQREKVEDEVRYHKAQQRQQQAETSPDSSVFDNQQPSSSDQLASSYTGGSVFDTFNLEFLNLIQIIFFVDEKTAIQVTEEIWARTHRPVTASRPHLTPWATILADRPITSIVQLSIQDKRL